MASKPAPALLTSPIGQGVLTCAGCGHTGTRYVLGSSAKAVRDAARRAGFNRVGGRGWLCLDCEFAFVAAPAAQDLPRE